MAVEQIKTTKKILIISAVLGFIAGQVRIKIGTFDDMHLITLLVLTLVMHFFFFKKYKDKKLWVYFIIGLVISLAITIVFAGIFYVYLSSLLK